MRQKIALVVGGSGGIGSAIVERLLRDDFSVCATYAHESNRLHDASVSWYQMDLSDVSATGHALKVIVKSNSRIDAVVFAPSASLSHALFFETDWKEFEKHHNTQVRGMWQIVKGLETQIKEKYGMKFIIILTESCIGKPPSRLASYVTAKYGLLGLAKTMAVDLAPYKCTTNCVSPGMVKTELIKSFPPKMVEMAAMQNPLQRIARPDDVAGVVSFLLSNSADYLNGVTIAVNGGGMMV